MGTKNIKTVTISVSIESTPCILLESDDDDFFEFILIPTTNTITLAWNATYTTVLELTPPLYCSPGTPTTYTTQMQMQMIRTRT